MEEIVKIGAIGQYNKMRGVETLHPLVTALVYQRLCRCLYGHFNFGVYAIGLKGLDSGELRYGRSRYDYREGTLVFTGQGRVASVRPSGGNNNVRR